MTNYDWVFGLNVMNITLGMMAAIPVLFIAYGAASELVSWVKDRRRGLRAIDAAASTHCRQFARTAEAMQ